jgi:hypothetical protein
VGKIYKITASSSDVSVAMHLAWNWHGPAPWLVLTNWEVLAESVQHLFMPSDHNEDGATDGHDHHENKRTARKRIKEITIRFNKEAAPFQHVRIEATATITKEDNADVVRQALRDFCEETFWDIKERMFSDRTQQQINELETAANGKTNAANVNENPY